MSVKPITPGEALKRNPTTIPDFVLEAFNELIAEGVNERGSVTVHLKDAVARIKRKMPKGTKFNDDWLDVENAYQRAGWHVKYDQPCGYGGESFSAYYEFSKKRR